MSVFTDIIGRLQCRFSIDIVGKLIFNPSISFSFFYLKVFLNFSFFVSLSPIFIPPPILFHSCPNWKMLKPYFFLFFISFPFVDPFFFVFSTALRSSLFSHQSFSFSHTTLTPSPSTFTNSIQQPIILRLFQRRQGLFMSSRWVQRHRGESNVIHVVGLDLRFSFIPDLFVVIKVHIVRLDLRYPTLYHICLWSSRPSFVPDLFTHELHSIQIWDVDSFQREFFQYCQTSFQVLQFKWVFSD